MYPDPLKDKLLNFLSRTQRENKSMGSIILRVCGRIKTFYFQVQQHSFLQICRRDFRRDAKNIFHILLETTRYESASHNIQKISLKICNLENTKPRLSGSQMGVHKDILGLCEATPLQSSLTIKVIFFQTEKGRSNFRMSFLEGTSMRDVYYTIALSYIHL